MGREEKAGGSPSERWQLGSSHLKAVFLSSKCHSDKTVGLFYVKRRVSSQTEGGVKGKPVQPPTGVVVLMHMLKIKEAQRSGYNSSRII